MTYGEYLDRYPYARAICEKCGYDMTEEVKKNLNEPLNLICEKCFKS